MKQLPEQLTKPYNPQSVETELYKTWEESGYFNPDNLPGERTESFTIVLPPPNVTGTLHTGSAIMLAIQDSIIRFKRMRGYKALWIPGTDHAAIATQSKVEKEIYKKEGKNRHDLGREEMLKRINEFALESQNTILSQMRSIGASLDWSRLAFTLDEKRNLAVRTMFKKMYDDGLIYRGSRIVNWDPKGQTTISDDEIVSEERKAILYTFKYSNDFPIAISTTRPETKVGDTAVAVHPEDERYKDFIGNEYDLEFAGCPIHIKVIADTAVEKDFGTGALGVTPAHSITDWEMADRHSLPRPQVINEYAKMVGLKNEELNGKRVTDAREYIVNWLKENNLLTNEEEITQNVPTAERTGGVIEPLPKLQWFIAVNKSFNHFGNEITLKKLMAAAVSSKAINILPDRFEKVYFHWTENLRDWCISRQIWYGHRIPVWYKEGKIYCDINSPKEEGWEQDEDTLDTWFSSGLWTFSTLGWPDQTKDLKTYHPTDLLETGHDILFFWIARMILFSTYALNEVPFKQVYLHGLVRDAKGRKMSKSLDNILDPRDLSEKYGTDALRMSLLVGNGPGNDLKLGEDKIKAYKLFANKIWNAARFVLERTQDFEKEVNLIEEDQSVYETWREIHKDITSDVENYRLHLATEKIYDYFWKVFCDEIIETRKTRILDDIDKASAQTLLLKLLREQLIVVHPFMPFITEELWKYVKKDGEGLLMITNWNG
ncbi:MAG: valS [Candidatus Nomurabacteria bacterium]|nr:valS [Candidatus Nomurabacteria bacterium]